MAAAALSGAASGIALFSDSMSEIHSLLHAHEMAVLALSAVLVLVGGGLELSGRRGHPLRGFPWLFAFSVFCFLVNAVIVVIHGALAPI